jgi:hypothetical protein
MAKASPDAMLDSAFDWLDQADKQVICSAQPTTYAEANATYALADVTMTPNTDYTKADNSTGGGRKVTVAAKSGVTVDSSGTATHVALVSTGDSTLRYVTTCTSQALTAGNTVNIPAWAAAIQDPT